MATKKDTQPVSICWLRRDLRLDDHAALYHALKGNNKVLVVFIFDRAILNQLPKNDARVTFIHQSLSNLNKKLETHNASLVVLHDTAEHAWQTLLEKFEVTAVYANHDYEPSAITRDAKIQKLLEHQNIPFLTFKDQVIFEKNEITKADGKPYTVFTPYYKQWLNKLDEFYHKSYPSERYLKNLAPYYKADFPTLQDLGFEESAQKFPSQTFEKKLDDYAKLRDFPAEEATTRIGMHLRFGTLSIRKVLAKALAHKADKWIAELAWREFYMMILYHFPKTATHAFKPDYDKIDWINDEKQFNAWCDGRTGYPLVDAGMRQLNETGFMHNRVRMVVASFLCKHLLIDWRWGEAYFAEKLLDYDQAANVGGWQWACGCGNDAAPYFRVFNPELQLKKFDPKMVYVFKYAPEYKQALHPIPIVEHTFARDRALKAYKKALQ